MHFLKTYLKFLLSSKNQYSVHSPFLYDYLTKGLMNQKLIDIEKAKSLRNDLEHNHLEIEVTDFGAGSKVFQSNKRIVSEIAAKAGISAKRGKLLAKTVAYFKPQNILEIGTSLGISTAYMASGAPNSKIISLEGCIAVAGIAKETLKNHGFKNISIQVGEFSKTLDTVLENNSFDLIFFDGNHQKEPTTSYFEKCLKSAHEDSVFIFDDIHWTREMEEAWAYIRDHKKVTLSVDTFKWGIVFFKKGRIKEHFTLRI